MGIFRKRPLVFAVCAAAALAVLVQDRSGALKPVLLAVSLFAGLLFSGICLVRHRVSAFCVTGILTAAACACLLLGSWLRLTVIPGRYLSRAGETVPVEGYVTERLSPAGNSSRFAVRLTEFDGERVRLPVVLECEYRSALQEGDRFRLSGSIRAFEKSEFYDEETYLRADGVVAVLVCADDHDCTVSDETVRTPGLFLRGINRRLCLRLQSAIGDEAGALACALLLGNRSFLSGDTTLAFRRAGISHLLALSGLHVSILIGLLEWLLCRLRAPRLLRVSAVPPLALGYLFLTGAAVSTVRAVLMATVLSFAFLLAEHYDAITSLSAALFCILAVTPYAVKDIALWLSFGAAASIVIFLPACRPLLQGRGWRRLPGPLARLLRGLLTAILTGLFAGSGILAVSVLCFGSTSVLSVPATLVLSPLVTAALLLGILTLLVPIPPVILLARLPLYGMLRFASLAAGTDNALIVPVRGAEWTLVWLSLVLVLATAILPLRRKGWVALPVAVAAAFLVTGYLGLFRPRETSVTYTHALSGETLVVTQARKSVVIDLTGGTSQSVAQTVAVLEEAGCAEVNDLVLSHYHAQVTALISRLCRRVTVRCVRLPVPVSDWELAVSQRLAEEAALHGIAVRYDTDALAVPDVQLLWLERFSGSGVEASLGLTLQVGDRVVTALSSQLVGSEQWLDLYRRLPGSDTLILLSHGKSATRPQTVRLPDSVVCVIWGDEETASLHPLDQSPATVHVGEDVVRIGG